MKDYKKLLEQEENDEDVQKKSLPVQYGFLILSATRNTIPMATQKTTLSQLRV